MMIPPAMDLATMKLDGKFPRPRLVLDCVVIFVGVGGLLGGSLASLLEIAGVDVCELLADEADCEEHVGNGTHHGLHALLPGMRQAYTEL